MIYLMRRYAHWNWALIDQALVSGTNFLVGILLVRYLGIEQYGQFVLAWMIVQFVMSVQNALIVSPMLSIAPKLADGERTEYLSATIVLQVVLALVCATLATGLALLPMSLKPGWLTPGVMIPLAACLVLVQLQDYVRRNLFCRRASRQAFYVDLLAYGVQIPLVFVVIKAYPAFENALIVIVLAMLISLAVGWRWLGLTPVADGKAISAAIRHWRSSKWLLGSAVLQWVSGNYFLVIAAAVLGPAAVGAIRAAQNLLGLTHILFQGLENIVPGEASQRLSAGGGRALGRYVAKVTLIMLIGTGLVAMVAAQLAEPLLRLAYGEVDPRSVMAMIWYVPIYMSIAVLLPLRAGLRSLERTRAIFIAYVLGASFALLSAGLMVKGFGIQGVMAGMLLVEAGMAAVLAASLLGLLRRNR